MVTVSGLGVELGLGMGLGMGVGFGLGGKIAVFDCGGWSLECQIGIKAFSSLSSYT